MIAPKPTMLKSEARFLLEDLDQIDIENLKAGRITRQVMGRAIRQIARFDPKRDFDVMCLADNLNNLLEAGRVLNQE